MSHLLDIGLEELTRAALQVHQEVCDIHFDESRMNADHTCDECINDLHEYEILTRK